MENFIIKRHYGKITTNNINILIDTIYNNFPDLKNNKNVKHNKGYINSLLNSENTYSIFIYNTDKNIIGYMIGEFIDIENRKVFFISYLCVAKRYRKNKIGSLILNDLLKTANLWNDVRTLMLSCNKKKRFLYDFYLKRGFLDDPQFRNYTDNEILSRII